jgi:hypothetical protein
MRESKEKQTRVEAAHDYLSGISSYFKSSTATHQARKLEEQKQGKIDHSTPKEHIERYSSQCGMVDACNAMMNNPPSYEVFEHFNEQMLLAADKRGDTFTKGYGDMRCYKQQAIAAKQRANNTGIDHASFLHLYARPSSTTNDQQPVIIASNNNKPRAAGSFDSRPHNAVFLPPHRPKDPATASAGTNNAMFYYDNEADDVPLNIAAPQSLTPPDVVELREAVEAEIIFGDSSDTARQKKLQLLSDDLHKEELSKQTKTKLAVLKKRNLATVQKMNLLLNQITLDD